MGWDIGGAHLKNALYHRKSASLHTRHVATPLWQGRTILERACRDAITYATTWAQHGARHGAQQTTQHRSHAPHDRPSRPLWHHIVTMSGEVADIFSNRREGVIHIMETLCALIKQDDNEHHVSFYNQRGEKTSLHSASTEPLAYASSNWRATAHFAAMYNPHPCLLLLDIGSTTSDITPIHHHTPLSHGHDDYTRLRHRELFYSGVIRTPLMACASHICFDSQPMPVCAELFATSGDIYLYNDSLPLAYHHMPTADGRGKSRKESIQRIARMIGRDSTTLSPTQQDALVKAFQAKHLQKLCDACLFVIKTPPFITHLQRHQPHELALWVTGCGHVLSEEIAQGLRHALSMPIRLCRLADIVLSSYPSCRATHATNDIDGKGGIDICAPAVALALLTAHHRGEDRRIGKVTRNPPQTRHR